MIRARFYANFNDCRPINWPIKYPFWCTGYSDAHSIVVAYADDLNYIYKNWPEAERIDYDEVDEIKFSDRFQCPDWYDPSGDV